MLEIHIYYIWLHIFQMTANKQTLFNIFSTNFTYLKKCQVKINCVFDNEAFLYSGYVK